MDPTPLLHRELHALGYPPAEAARILARLGARGQFWDDPELSHVERAQFQAILDACRPMAVLELDSADRLAVAGLASIRRKHMSNNGV
jgi:hypothetical protein